MPLNCGLDALSKLSEIKNISAFTLVHAARDNGLNLHVFKVNDLADLPRVQRPAIFHQNDHFVYVKNGEAMPDGEYTGFVIGSAVLGRVIGLSEAKFITGGKNFLTGKNSDGEQTGHGALIDILATVAAIGTTIATGGNVAAGAAVASAITTGGGAVERGQNADQLGKPGDPKLLFGDAVRGGAEGFAAGGATAGVSAANAGAAASGTTLNLGQQGVAAFQGAQQAVLHPIATTVHGLDTTAVSGSLASNTAAFNQAAGGAANAAGVSSAGINAGSNAANVFQASSPAMSLATGGVGNVAGQAVNPIYQSTASNFTPNSNFSLSSIPSLSSSVPATAGAGSAATGAGGLFGNAGSSIINPATIVGAAGILGSKTPQMEGSATGNYSAASTFLGDSAYKQLQQPTSNTLLSYINTPIADLQQQFTQNNKRTLDTINTAYDNQRQQIVHQYAQAGQNLANSSELQDKVGQLEQKRTNDLTLAQQELTDQALGQAIQVKQNALSSSLQQGQYDSNTAMDLAKLIGEDQVLQHAIETNDYQTFQGVMGKILTAGLPSQTIKIT